MGRLRKTIRQRVETLLSQRTSAAHRVAINPAAYENPYPYVDVSTPLESTEIAGHSPQTVENTLHLVIDAFSSAIDGRVNDALDDLASQIEGVLCEDETLGGLVSSLLLTRTETAKSEEGKASIGMIRLSYECVYYEENAPTPKGLRPLCGVGLELSEVSDERL